MIGLWSRWHAGTQSKTKQPRRFKLVYRYNVWMRMQHRKTQKATCFLEWRQSNPDFQNIKIYCTISFEID